MILLSTFLAIRLHHRQAAEFDDKKVTTRPVYVQGLDWSRNPWRSAFWIIFHGSLKKDV